MASCATLSKANTTFCLALLRKLSEENNTANVFFSPLSVSSALAMLMLGARGNTATQMSECLKTQDCQDDVHTQFAKLLSDLNKPGFLHNLSVTNRLHGKPGAQYDLSVANRLYGNQTFQYLQEFLTETRTHYNSEPESVDFETNPEEARVKINSWMEKQTHGKIKDIVAKGSLNNLTRLVLVNAIHFKGLWMDTFKIYLTHEAEFRLNKTNKKTVIMMKQETSFPIAFIPEVSCQILELPYEGNEMSMLIFLPKEIEDDTTGLEKLEKTLTYENFMNWTSPDKMKYHRVDLSLPRFKIEEAYELNKELSSMGMVDAFDESKCDLSGMSDSGKLFVSKVSHKAFVEVNEVGTEAAAGSCGFAELCSLSLEPVQNFTADHPFLFFIRHTPTMSIVFAGRFCSPP